MDLIEFKKQFVKTELGITDEYGRIATMVDFGNVNYWFETDRQTDENVALAEDEKFVIDLQGLNEFAGLFSSDVRFYYGHDPANPKSIGFITAAKNIFGGKRVFTKHMQFVRHHLSVDELESNKRLTFQDNEGMFVKIPKCNFDVEITVDAVRRQSEYDTLVLMSSDADFAALLRYLKKLGKKVILIKTGHITAKLRDSSDLVVSAQKIKKYIAKVVVKSPAKQKPGD